jgi:hypothetical protein
MLGFVCCHAIVEASLGLAAPLRLFLSLYLSEDVCFDNLPPNELSIPTADTFSTYRPHLLTQSRQSLITDQRTFKFNSIRRNDAKEIGGTHAEGQPSRE